MKRILFFLVFSAITFPGFSKNYLLQSKSKSRIQATGDQGALMFYGGYFQTDFSSLNNYMHQFGNNSFSPFQTVGLGIVAPCGGGSGIWNGSMDGGIIIPQQINEGDSMKFRMAGWYLITSLYSYDLLGAYEKFAWEIAPGIDWGQLHMSTTDKNSSLKYFNAFIAPLARTEFRVILQPFAFGIRALYRYDITNPTWKADQNQSASLPHSRISGLGFQVFVGWGKTLD